MGVWSASLANLGVPLPDLFSLPGAEARILLALRLAVSSHKQQVDARAELSCRLGSDRAMNRFLIIIETIGNAWPESFHVGRSCCPYTTPDEILLLQMIRLSAGGNRPAFDSLLCEMIGENERERIFGDLNCFIATYQSG